MHTDAEMLSMFTYPSFIGIGAQKAGTTWLYKMLRLHPDVGMPEQKELHFWDLGIPDAAGFSRYQNAFAPLHGCARGEITPSYSILPRDRIAMMRNRLPALRLIYILRNPVERAWSQARMELARELHRGRSILPAEWNSWLVAHCSLAESRSRGDYAACLRNWFGEYGREQFLIAIHEENLLEPCEFLMACARHLGVDPGFYAEMSRVTMVAPVSPEKEILGIEPLDMHARPPQQCADVLLDMYIPCVRDAEIVLGRNLMQLWFGPYS